jgi:hypothetical protein
MVGHPSAGIRDSKRTHPARSNSQDCAVMEVAMHIEPNESDLKGQWLLVDGKLVKDEVSKRIEALVEKYLTRVRADKSGWNTLFRDPSDGRFWELTYSNSEMHGGGPPRLSAIDKSLVAEKYGAG